MIFLIQNEINKMISEIIDKEIIVDDSKPTDSNNNQTVVGGLSLETFFTLSHTLRAMTDCIKYLLDVKNLNTFYQEK